MIDLAKDITLVIGIDAKTIEQLKVSWPTWKKNRPLIWDWQWIIFYDHEQLAHGTVFDLAELMGCPDPTMFVAWPTLGTAVEYESQRAKMLSGHVFVPAMHCRTKYHCKIDTDALARPGGLWPDPEWFRDEENLPSVIAPHWGYTKGFNWLGLLEDWGNQAMSNFPKLGCRNWPNFSEHSKRVGHHRWCSWNSLYATKFTKLVAGLCQGSAKTYRLPVPSQDTTMWYVAERMNFPIQLANMKKRGWSNHPKIHDLKRVAAEIMAAEHCGA